MKELEFANGLADLADEISLRYFRKTSISIKSKQDGTVVTQADEEIERVLRTEIEAAYPDHGIFGEEEGESGPADLRWILDPIDGTLNYSWGIPIWATLIALEVKGRIECGVVSAPAISERYSASRGNGAVRNGEPIGVSAVSDPAQARIGFGSFHAFEDAGASEAFIDLLRSGAQDRGIGDFYGHMLVASGSLEVMVEPRLRAWDLAPLIVIVEEAGGRLTDLEGKPHIYGGSVVTTNGPLHEHVLGVLGGRKGP